MLPPVTRGADAHVFSEYKAKQLLKAHGLAVPEGIVCAAEDAVAAAERLGYPGDAQGLLRGHRPQDGSGRRGAEPAGPPPRWKRPRGAWPNWRPMCWSSAW